MEKTNSIQIELPVVALQEMTVLPDMIIHFDLNRKTSIEAVERAMTGGQQVFLSTQKQPETEAPSKDTLYEIGTIAAVKQVTKLPNNGVRVLVEGLARARLLELKNEPEEFYNAVIERIEEDGTELEAEEEEAMLRTIRELFLSYYKFYPRIGKNLLRYFKEPTEISFLLNQIAISIPFNYEDKQKILEETDPRVRFILIATLLTNENQVGAIRADIADKIKAKIDKNQKEFILREQLSYIREALGEKDAYSDVTQFEQALEKLKADKDIKDKIKKEIARFQSIMGSSSESAVERSYIETLLELPWNKVSKDNMDIDRAEEILKRDHYGLEKVKERIIEFLAVRCLTSQGEAPILCLVGPPGTGKTSIAKSIADSLNKHYVRICLGGVKDEAEIRGHRKTYIGAMPGRIAEGLKQAGVSNPLMLLDEIDKVSNDYKGDTSSALLEVLDPEQNCRFRDHYVELPINLSKVLFIATANDANKIPRPLLDRMELIEISSYTANEKFHIAKEHLLRKQLKKNGLTQEMLTISDGALRDMIEYYTKEAGVRGLERKIGGICRKAAREILQKHVKAVKVTGNNLEKYLGKRKYKVDMANETDEIGIVRGLAWTSVGGDTLQIEVNIMPGKGEIELTGQLGDVMKESARAGISYIRSVSKKYRIAENYFSEHDFHIHIPEGAVPKDGPSAGITMATSLLSAITKTPVSCKVAMTGEITLRGRVLPIGGLKEKMLAAKTAGITTLLIPKENEKDVAEIAKEIKSGMTIYYVQTMDDVVEHAFVRKGRKSEK